VSWNCGELLILQELKAVVIRSDEEQPTPEIGSLMAHGKHQANELPFVCYKRCMLGGELLAEEHKRPATLM
jgi:hypothetical protein